MNVRKLAKFQIYKLINDKSRGVFITNLSFSLLVKKIKIREHLAKLQAQWLIVSYAPFALDFCPQRCRTRQISKITRIWREETVTNCCYVHRQINVSLLSTNIKLLQPVDQFRLTDRLTQSATDKLLKMYGSETTVVQEFLHVFLWCGFMVLLTNLDQRMWNALKYFLDMPNIIVLPLC